MVRRVRGLLVLGVLMAGAASAGCGLSGAPAGISGAQLYGGCVSCHGPNGEGTAAIGAPRIAGMPQWYVASQLERFQTGLRGKHPDDMEGLRMRAMSRQLLSADEIRTVAEYVSGLKAVTNSATLTAANVSSGKDIYARCVPCHGPEGAGSEAVKAPPIAGQDDWYIRLQLKKFRTGVRGAAEGDALGPIMKAMASTLEPDGLDHVAAYVHSLAK